MMDKSCHSSADSTITSCSSNSNSNRDHYLKHLNKISHKISKPIRKPTFDHHHIQQQHQHPAPPPQESQPQNLQQQHQPPVYNINKSDFRDVVQKLTGSPAHERFSTPPPIHPPKPPSSRLQRIRPPPLVHVGNRPPPLLNNAVPSQLPPQNGFLNRNNPVNTTGAATSGNFINNQRQLAPLSPLPPFPTVHAAAESPISAYMRLLQNSITTVDSDPKRFPALSPLAPLVSPRWNNLAHSQPPQHQQQLQPPPQSILPSPRSTAQSHLLMPSSPLPFGWLPSPRSPYPLLSPSSRYPCTVKYYFSVSTYVCNRRDASGYHVQFSMTHDVQ
ncbi:hypothetical protein F0562_035658 [Nyssa sinensis]|uniref:VQ domain-containing protein n=1 Tax=Nyssa sinensis TaxID=561372 RepID=A0A5J5ABK7_9ASTE|nr:hypothetical protein F0562_035658 [Nyssa sinensis]